MMGIAIRFAVLVMAAGSCAYGSAVARDSVADPDVDSRSECAKDALDTGSRIRQSECRKLDSRKRAAVRRAGMDQVADTLKKDAASGSTRTRAMTN